jgi:hypothetical protein
MNNRIWLGLLLFTLSMIAPGRTATAQGPRRDLLGRPPLPNLLSPKQSHHDLPGGIDMANAEELMAQRLQELHELHQLQDQVQGLLEDPEFRKQLESIPDSDLRKLQEKMLKGKGLRSDPNWEKMLQQVASHQKLNERQLDIIRRWAERHEQTQPAPSQSSLPQNSDPGDPPPLANASSPPVRPMLPPTPAAPEPSLAERIQEGTKKWMLENLDNVGGDLVEALAEIQGNEENSPLAELLRSVEHPDFSGLNVPEQAIGFSRYLSDAGDFLHQQRGTWDEMQSIFHKSPVPSLPNFNVPSASIAASAANGDHWAPTLLASLLLGTIILVLCLRGLGSKSPSGSGEGDEWRLGSWPVSPGHVSTRQELIRAFEYLALLCLGTAAGAWNHRELAERLAEQDSANPSRRQAVEMLAWLYEKARYAPAEEALSPEQLSDARHALCLLAGVTAI